ncbi:MAG: DUF1592 domain-containing protein, partial [Planctomycetota bacterium]
TDWWTEVFAVITKGEMPPRDAGEMEDRERLVVVDWLSNELRVASAVRRSRGSRSAFRRMTRYEYNYALQDLLGLPWDFAKDLPPEARSEDGFENSSEALRVSVSQFETYHRIAREALDRATVTGDRPPTLHWNISLDEAAEREWSQQEKQIQKLKSDLGGDPDKLAVELEMLRDKFRQPVKGAYFKKRSSDRVAEAKWKYQGARYAFAPREEPSGEGEEPSRGDEEPSGEGEEPSRGDEEPSGKGEEFDRAGDKPSGKSDGFSWTSEESDCVAILPNGQGPKLIFELGNRLPDEGNMRVTVRASRVESKGSELPSLQLYFGWQASNEGRALMRVSENGTPVGADPSQPQTVQWDIPLGEIYPRNSVRKTSPMGKTPSPSEYIRLVNDSASSSELQIEFVHVAAPVHDQWPPESHRQIFEPGGNNSDERVRARKTIAAFMNRAWRRPVGHHAIDRKLKLFDTMRGQCGTFEETIIEVLATVLSSPQFLYVAKGRGAEAHDDAAEETRLDSHALADRLALFLWCSIPDRELRALAASGRLSDLDVLEAQVHRMLDHPRSRRFSNHFVHQWLDLELLEFQDFKRHVRGFDPLLKEAMLREPVALFDEVLQKNASVLDFVHCDYAMLNERLARHYGVPSVVGNHFRRVPLKSGFRRGGLLTQAGPLAMNADWPDSHPLKRAIWMLNCILADPPPPPPPAVPQIDLADPEIAKMTLKERIEDHRQHAACMSCHVKIDPWGIAFENYDALGRWRDQIDGRPVDASSEWFNGQTLDGMEGLKRFLLEERQDQLVHALVSKLAIYALGRPLDFEDRAQLDSVTAHVRREGDGLRTVISSIVRSELFRSP